MLKRAFNYCAVKPGSARKLIGSAIAENSLSMSGPSWISMRYFLRKIFLSEMGTEPKYLFLVNKLTNKKIRTHA